MATLSVMMKPASGSCDLRCRYCFYADESRNRETENFGQMSEQTLEQVVKKTLQYATDGCTFGFQGGEPTLRGLEFFQRLRRWRKSTITAGCRWAMPSRPTACI